MRGPHLGFRRSRTPPRIASSFTHHRASDGLRAPLPDEPAPGWGLDVAGRLPAMVSVKNDHWNEGSLKGDLKFAKSSPTSSAGSARFATCSVARPRLARFLLAPGPAPPRRARTRTRSSGPASRGLTVLFCDLRGSCRIVEDWQDNFPRLWERVSEASGS